MKSELSFTAQGQECLSRISENVVVDASTSYGTQHQPWGGRGQDGDNSIVFSAPPKRSKTNDPDFLTALDSQVPSNFNYILSLNFIHYYAVCKMMYCIVLYCIVQFSLPQTTLEMAAVENMLHIPQDSVPCKIRAKRGCATHPRSIAERVTFLISLYSLYIILTVISHTPEPDYPHSQLKHNEMAGTNIHQIGNCIPPPLHTMLLRKRSLVRIQKSTG